MIRRSSIENFYKETNASLPEGISRELGHFNVFETEKLLLKETGDTTMPYSRRDYYKISLIQGKNRAEYADKVIDIRENALLFATPRIPYHYIPQDGKQAGHFCIFTADFLSRSKTGIVLDELPIFRPGEYPIFQLGREETAELEDIFRKMHREMNGGY